MSTYTERLKHAAALAAVALALVGGQQLLTAALTGELLRADLAHRTAVATLVSGLAVQVTAVAFWPTLAAMLLRAGIGPATLRFAIHMSIAVIALRVAVEAGIGARIGDFPLLGSAIVIGALSALLGPQVRHRRRRRRGGISVLPKAGERASA